jgi:hypothetical protein
MKAVLYAKPQASTTRSPVTPRTRRRASSTVLRGSAPIAQVPQAWNTVPARARKSASTSASDLTFSPGSRSFSVTADRGPAADRIRSLARTQW